MDTNPSSWMTNFEDDLRVGDYQCQKQPKKDPLASIDPKGRVDHVL